MDTVQLDIIRQVLDILESSSKAQRLQLQAYLREFKTNEVIPSGAKSFDDKTWIALAEELKSQDRPGDAMTLLLKADPNKKELLIISRNLGVSIQRSDRIDQIRDKIVHEAVSARLNSEAIRRRHD